MLQLIFSFIIGCIAALLYVVNLLAIPPLVILSGLLRILIPVKWWSHSMNFLIHRVLTPTWIAINVFIIHLTIKVDWDIKGQNQLDRSGKYFLICNHSSWTDILVLYKALGLRTPTKVFFMKRELLWTLPIISWACWASDYPFLHRPTKSRLKNRPDKKLHDREATLRTYNKFQSYPVTVVNFVEGTRFTAEKKQQQNSPYQHLLKPKASSVAFAINALQDSLHEIINVTIIYPNDKVSLWRFMCGRISKIIVRYEVIPITADLRGDFYGNREFRIYFQNWLNKLWQTKDNLITNFTPENTNHEQQ